MACPKTCQHGEWLQGCGLDSLGLCRPCEVYGQGFYNEGVSTTRQPARSSLASCEWLCVHLKCLR